MQVDAARAMARYWLESPYTQRMLDKLMEDHPETGVYCAYTKAFDNPGQDVEFNAKEDIPGRIIYPHSRELAVATYLNGKFALNLKPRPSESEINPETGWLLDKERVPDYGDANIVAVSPTFYLGYYEGYGKLYLNWQQLCAGLPFLVWDPYEGFLTREMLRNPDVVDELQPGTVVALLEALFYEMERAEPGYGKVREIYFAPFLPATLIDLNTIPDYENAKWLTQNYGVPPIPGDRNKWAASIRYTSIVLAEGRLRPDQESGWYTSWQEGEWMGEPPDGYGEQSYSSDDVSKTLLWPVDNKPPYVPVVLPDTATDGLYAQADIPLAVTSDFFWRRLLVEMGYQRPDDADFKAGKGTVLDLMFGLNLPNFRPDQAQAQPLAFNLGEGPLYNGFTDGVYHTYGTMLANPLRMATLMKQVEQLVFDVDPEEVTNQFLADYELAIAPLVPALQFHLNPKGAVVYADWKPVTSAPELQGYQIGTESTDIFYTPLIAVPDAPNMEVHPKPFYTFDITLLGDGWHGNYSFGKTFYLGGGRARGINKGDTEDYGTMYSPRGAASGRWHYGGPVFFQLTDIEVSGHRLPFPFEKFGDTYVNPETGRYTLSTEAIAALSDNPDDVVPNTNPDNLLTDFGAYVACAPYADPTDVPNAWFRIAVATACLRNVAYQVGNSYFPLYMESAHHPGRIHPEALESVRIAQGFGQAVLQSTVLLMGDVVDNPDALGDIKLVDWLQEDQEALQKAAQDGQAVYDPRAPYFGLYWLPTYHVPVYYFAINPVCQFDAACLVMSNEVLARPGHAPQAYPSPLGMPIITDTAYSEFYSDYREDIARKFGNHPLSNPLLWDHYEFIGSVGYVGPAEMDVVEPMRDEKAILNRLVEKPYWYVPDIDQMLATGGYTRQTYPLSWWDVQDEEELRQLQQKFNGEMVAYLAPFYLLSSSHYSQSFLDVLNYWPLSLSYHPNDYKRAFDGEHWPTYMVPLGYEDRYRIIPPGVELQAVADEAGVCLPWPHPEQGECAVGVRAGEETQWYVPTMETDYEALVKFMQNWANDIGGQVVSTHEPQKMGGLCEASLFAQAQQMFGDDVAQRLWQVAYMMAYEDPEVQVPTFQCANNDDYLRMYGFYPWYTPTLAQMLADGKFGGLANPPKAWQRPADAVWRDFWFRIDAYLRAEVYRFQGYSAIDIFSIKAIP